MILYPAIDLKDGQCVRLLRGDMDAATVFNASPADQAASFARAGADWIHVVDLNGAFSGQSENGDAVSAIIAAAGDKVKIQLGGGIRSVDHVAAWLDRGVSRVILGTVAVKQPDIVTAACTAFPGKVAVGIDARGGKVAVEGWAETTEQDATDLAKRFEDAGVAAVIYTDIDRDGAMQGVNVQATKAMADAVALPIIASGGVSSLDDLRALKEAGGIAGAISGRALYDGRIDLAEAMALLAEEEA
ncbi:1-(5-phosphoribosyl)-5-[(5-phosphoribosylamino)methylideneamino]imidazole-4-carboxamide isomerase [Rhodospirillaceae bacterium KN72]|uniref:1-(5-phosphoribosyl)-5-[(5-phosphoribosylamino)methylideneamino] imidazole-4-carboxamide isomerase n=1 Tax=Pacificispira spongiicola TaxID=2729598 RepID=A0A7Y0E0S8_9PROT|nr:1-(5-phosphoribosyl)-5-[(5-phosphoribosylamino)methylideneamino]imidazole-4-carboxamide isomerase [Pacificispira spongiicola]NMM45104.1 1-(5-phosphoribosyl)-5-[(5-phosphoribosylamino)methylideneamino]imidazole-4-carboxamide isomerase [Pacificispira spongiicola]